MLDNQGVSKLSSKQANLLSIMVALNAWEQNYSVPLKTQSGRSLYFQLAQALLAPDACDGVMMKQRWATPASDPCEHTCVRLKKRGC